MLWDEFTKWQPGNPSQKSGFDKAYLKVSANLQRELASGVAKVKDFGARTISFVEYK